MWSKLTNLPIFGTFWTFSQIYRLILAGEIKQKIHKTLMLRFFWDTLYMGTILFIYRPYMNQMLHISHQYQSHIQGVPKKWTFCICSISKELRNGFLNNFFLLKTDTHMYILNTEPFLDDIRGLRYIQNKTWF